jgi:ferric-dicitrate binding protein FerR (iron transport regulator)
MDLKENEIDGTLLLKYLNGTANPEEQSNVDTWLAEDTANSDTLLQVARIYHAQRTRQRIRERNTDRALDLVNHRMGQRLRRIVIRRLAVAASLFIGLLGIGSMFWQNRQVESLPQMITVNTNAGMRSQLTLPDSTVVFLNAGSTLLYPSQYDKNERRVQLSGEAYFKVTHNTRQPFVVSAADDKMSIRVLGTAFNVQTYEKDSLAQIALIEGSVQVSIQGQKGNVQLTPSNMLTYDMKSDKVSVKKINTDQVTAWMDGRLIFKDTPIPEVLRQLNHFYSVDFDVQDTVISGYTFTGTFENRPLFQIMDYLKISSKIEYTMLYPENQEIRKPVIRLKKEGSKR